MDLCFSELEDLFYSKEVFELEDQLELDDADWLDGMTTPVGTIPNIQSFEPSTKSLLKQSEVPMECFGGDLLDKELSLLIQLETETSWDALTLGTFDAMPFDETPKKRKTRAHASTTAKKIKRNIMKIKTESPVLKRLITKDSDATVSMEDDEAEKSVAKRWTPEQDEELRIAVERHNGQNWKAIASMVTCRDHVQCLQRWKKVLQPGLIKGMWTEEEDALLVQLMNASKVKNWAEIAKQVPGRTAKQCRERWSLNLDPSINRSSWTKSEDDLLIKLHSDMGNKWAEIKRHLNGRTENGVKTRFKSLERAKIKDQEVVWTPELEQQLHEISSRFECRFDEVTKHLPRALRGISSQAMRDHCSLLREHEEKMA